jgi:hypothetical protein
MKPIRLLCSLIAAAALLVGCGTVETANPTLPIPGQTLASLDLQSQTLQRILNFEQHITPDCRNYQVVDSDVLERPDDLVIQNSVVARGVWQERWTLNRCGTEVVYLVAYHVDSPTSFTIDINRLGR